MWERFTDRARKVMVLANQEAQFFNHSYIGTEHILLGLVKEGVGVAAHVLKNLDVGLRRIRLEVEKIVQRGPGIVIPDRLPQTPRAKKVIEYAVEEARNHNHNYVGTEHLLLGLLREQEGVAAVVLYRLGLTTERVRQEVLSLLGTAASPEPAALAREGELLDLFSERGREAMNQASREARACKCEQVGTEHLLLGILGEESGSATEILKAAGGDLEKILAAVRATVPPGPFMVPVGK
jgi:ATP-dependent Clp protease ATP-binding subunit ClpA